MYTLQNPSFLGKYEHVKESYFLLNWSYAPGALANHSRSPSWRRLPLQALGVTIPRNKPAGELLWDSLTYFSCSDDRMLLKVIHNHIITSCILSPNLLIVNKINFMVLWFFLHKPVKYWLYFFTFSCYLRILQWFSIYYKYYLCFSMNAMAVGHNRNFCNGALLTGAFTF